MFLLVKNERKRYISQKIRIELNLHSFAYFGKYVNTLSLPPLFNVVTDIVSIDKFIIERTI